ncbi:MAG: PepSY-associated TM helix domain-containing protein [Alcanivorax sp.]|nr:PepSY-associated TM helix domain-containing protein [Alcanivorax sp.]
MTTSSAAKKAAWFQQVIRWHWISSAICLIGMLLFAVTGITLNHAASIEAAPVTTTWQGTLPAHIRAGLTDYPDGETPLPRTLRHWLRSETGTDPGTSAAEWDGGEIYLSLPRPGGDAWLSIDTESGDWLMERTTRGAVAWLNDLHKGRNTGTAWSWFIDIFALACVVFCVTGLLLLQRYASSRRSTWPLVALGLAAPLLLIILFVHT